MIGKLSKDIEEEIEDKGFHIFRKSYSIRNMYPNAFPDYGEIKQINIGSIYAVRLFVKNIREYPERIDSGFIDVKIESSSKGTYLSEILTLLPETFPIKKGDKLILSHDELLYENG
jgi:hypothetical protein